MRRAANLHAVLVHEVAHDVGDGLRVRRAAAAAQEHVLRQRRDLVAGAVADVGAGCDARVRAKHHATVVSHSHDGGPGLRRAGGHGREAEARERTQRQDWRGRGAVATTDNQARDLLPRLCALGTLAITAAKRDGDGVQEKSGALWDQRARRVARCHNTPTRPARLKPATVCSHAEPGGRAAAGLCSGRSGPASAAAADASRLAPRLPGQNVDLYIPRKCSWTNRLITAKDHASIQINVGHLDEQTGVFTGQSTTFALSGFVRAMVRGCGSKRAQQPCGGCECARSRG